MCRPSECNKSVYYVPLLGRPRHNLKKQRWRDYKTTTTRCEVGLDHRQQTTNSFSFSYERMYKSTSALFLIYCHRCKSTFVIFCDLPSFISFHLISQTEVRGKIFFLVGHQIPPSTWHRSHEMNQKILLMLMCIVWSRSDCWTRGGVGGGEIPWLDEQLWPTNSVYPLSTRWHEPQPGAWSSAAQFLSKYLPPPPPSPNSNTFLKLKAGFPNCFVRLATTITCPILFPPDSFTPVAYTDRPKIYPRLDSAFMFKYLQLNLLPFVCISSSDLISYRIPSETSSYSKTT